MAASVPAHERVLYLHVGTHKTGTTAIQRFFADNDAAFAASGICYPRAARLPDFPGHHNAAFELNRDPRFDPAFGTLADLFAEIQTSGAKRACISSEDFEFLHVRPSVLRATREAIVSLGYRPVLVVYLRAQSDYLESLYAEMVKFGSSTSVDEFVTDVVRDGFARFRDDWVLRFEYSKMLEPIAGAFGKRNVIVRPYAPAYGGYDAVQDLVEIVGGGAQTPGVDETVRIEHVRPCTGNVIRWLFDNTARELDDAAISAAAEPYASRPEADAPFSVLTRDQRDRVAQHFARDNAGVVKRWKLPAGALDPAFDRASDTASRALFAQAESARRTLVEQRSRRAVVARGAPLVLGGAPAQ